MEKKASNTAQDVKGKIKEAVGRTTGNKKLERQGQTDQVKAAVKVVGEDVKDVASTVKHALTKKK